MKQNNYHYTSPTGELLIFSSEHSIQKIDFLNKKTPRSSVIKANPVIIPYLDGLDQYFVGKLRTFQTESLLKGLPSFQQKVLSAVCLIPYGETKSYKDIAEEIGKPKAARAVGNACNKNPFPILIPCHRVLGADGQLKGYLGGLAAKKWLLNFEKQNPV